MAGTFSGNAEEAQDPAYRQTVFFKIKTRQQGFRYKKKPRKLVNLFSCQCQLHKTRAMTPQDKEKSLMKRISDFLSWAIHFVTYDIWRITENEVSGLKIIYLNIIKTIILAVR